MVEERVETRYPEHTRLAMIISLILAAVYTLFDFFNHWIGSPLTVQVIGVWVLGLVALLIVFPLLCYLSGLIWAAVTTKTT